MENKKEFYIVADDPEDCIMLENEDGILHLSVQTRYKGKSGGIKYGQSTCHLSKEQVKELVGLLNSFSGRQK